MNKFKFRYEKSKKLPIALSLDIPKDVDRILYKIHDKIDCVKLNPAYVDPFSVVTYNTYTIIDGKFGDVKHSMEAYKNKYFNQNINSDFKAVTLNPYCGESGLKVFTEDENVFSFIWTLSSDISMHSWQRPVVDKLFESDILNGDNIDNVGLVVPSTCLDFIVEVREKYPDRLLLLPGVGMQGGSIKKVKKIIGIKNVLFVIGRSILNAKDVLDYLKTLEGELYD